MPRIVISSPTALDVHAPWTGSANARYCREAGLSPEGRDGLGPLIRRT
jgi:hypothetical protein